MQFSEEGRRIQIKSGDRDLDGFMLMSMSMVRAARFIVLATAIERNISSYFWLSTCGAANLDLSAFGDCEFCFVCLEKKKYIYIYIYM